MGRYTCIAFFTFCLILVTVSGQQQLGIEDTNAIQQQPEGGFIDRIMREYVYPIRDYDWRGMVRRFFNGVLDYVAPDVKEPKTGGPYYGQAQDRTAVMVRRMLNRAIHYVESLIA